MARQFKRMQPTLLDSNRINFIRGKASVGAATPDELLSVFAHYDVLELWLDEKDCDDYFGTEGWRHAIGMPGVE